MDSLLVEIRGTSPLLMHSDVLVNPLAKETKEIRAYTGKRKKTEEDLATIAYLEWRGGLYFSEKVGVYIPGQNVHSCLVEAAKNTKSGKKAKSGLFVSGVNGEEQMKLLYEGPTTLEDLWAQGFYDARSVRIGTGKLMRYRPIFREWGLKFRVILSPEILERNEVETMIEFAGDFVGLCDYRPRFGRFQLVNIEKI